MEIIRLIEEGREDIWRRWADFGPVFSEVGAPYPPVEHLDHIKVCGGEKIVLVDDGALLGWIGIVPEPQHGFAELAGIQVHARHRKQGHGKTLIQAARTFLNERGIGRLVFRTSPLLASNACLYIKTFRTRYTWAGSQPAPPHNIPWPVVDCEMTWDGTKSVHNVRDTTSGLWEDAPAVVTWNGHLPEVIESALDGPLPRKKFPLPFLSLPILYPMIERGERTLFDVTDRLFTRLTSLGYRFAAFDALERAPGLSNMFSYLFDREPQE